MSQRLAVTSLAEFVHRRGDLHSRLEGRTRAEEGIAAQSRLQRGKPAGYDRERRVERAVKLGGEECLLGGRIDGCCVEARLVEEYKTTRSDHALAHRHYQSVHWAQIQLYGALLARELGCDAEQSWCLRLIYVHPDSLACTTFERQWSGAQLADFLATTLAWYDAWLLEQRAHLGHRDETITGLAFPFASYRPHQRALAQRAYKAMRDGEAMLLEAPTGSGKTMGLLYPALKALPVAAHQRLFYLTSRTTGANAALEACIRLDAERKFLRVVQITAKAQACAWSGESCNEAGCEFAQGYFDRIHDAVRDLLGRRCMTPEAIAAVSQAHRVCPFELSLDAARWADVIIGDYNYIFDPVVRLQRFADDAKLALLVDESHQLSARVQEMLALELDRAALRAALTETLPRQLALRLRAVDRQLRTLNQRCALPADGGARVIPEPATLLAAIQRLVEVLASDDIDLTAFPLARDVCFACVRWVRSRSWYEPESCIYVASAERLRGGVISVRVRLVHLDPGGYIAGVLAGYSAHIRFSGTVSPLDLYQRLHGMQGAAAERAGSPFAPEQLAVRIVTDIPTFYRQRSLGLERLAMLICEVAAAQKGNYLVAFPSFAYLRACADTLRRAHPHLNVIEQTPAMQPEAKAHFLSEFQQSEHCSVGLVVLGGMFAESVNLADQRGSTLAGVVCVGIGIPPPSVEREAMARYFAAQGHDGAAVAYHQPAMTKVLQVAGRLLRDPEDKGVLVLVDARFRDPAYQRFFPAHWLAEVVAASFLGETLEKFWRPAPGSPRLPAARPSTLELIPD
jgi:Rad3-related DNA helicase